MRSFLFFSSSLLLLFSSSPLLSFTSSISPPASDPAFPHPQSSASCLIPSFPASMIHLHPLPLQSSSSWFCCHDKLHLHPTHFHEEYMNRLSRSQSKYLHLFLSLTSFSHHQIEHSLGKRNTKTKKVYLNKHPTQKGKSKGKNAIELARAVYTSQSPIYSDTHSFSYFPFSHSLPSTQKN